MDRVWFLNKMQYTTNIIQNNNTGACYSEPSPTNTIKSRNQFRMLDPNEVEYSNLWMFVRTVSVFPMCHFSCFENSGTSKTENRCQCNKENHVSRNRLSNGSVAFASWLKVHGLNLGPIADWRPWTWTGTWALLGRPP